jgi:hypothetical protein
MTTALTPTDLDLLATCEETIARGLQTFTEVGQALARIKAQKLYRASHDSFEAYCKDRWGFARAHAYRLIDAAKVAENVSPIGDIPKESQARELARLPTAQQQDAWKEAIDQTDGKPTAAVVREIVERRLEPTPEPIEPEVIDAGPCQHGGEHEFCDEGHCVKCFEPAPDAEDEPVEPYPIGEYQQALRELIEVLRSEVPHLSYVVLKETTMAVVKEFED